MKVASYNVDKNNSSIDVPDIVINEIDLGFLFPEEDWSYINDIATKIRGKFSSVFIFGVGGSSLAGHAMLELQDENDKIRMQFVDTLEEAELQTTVRSIDNSCFVFITRSGDTVETIAQLNFVISALKNNNKNLSDHFVILTSPDTNLHKFAVSNNIDVIFHPKISGRYSCFTSVALFPVLIAGVDIEQLLLGATYEASLGIEKDFSLRMLNFGMHCIMPYTKKLKIFTEWYSQLIAESLAKDGKGYAILRSLGPKDQHNQLQMFLGGKDDKSYTFINIDSESKNIVKNVIPEFGDSGFVLSDIINIGMNSVCEELINENKLVRVINFDKFNEYNLGRLFMFFIKEALLQAKILDVDPFTQPNVAMVRSKMFHSTFKK